MGRVEIVDRTGTRSYNPDSVFGVFGCDELHRSLIPVEGARSICSGDPAVLYRTHEAEIALTPEEVYRLTMRALTPEEFKAIYERVGYIWELHEDFYDPDTGFAEQPQVPVPGYEYLTDHMMDEEDEVEDLRVE
jgi:hypothetical protein